MLLDATRFREDLSPVVDTLLLTDDDMKYLSFVKYLPKIKDAFGAPVTAQKHEWLDDAARAISISVQASGDGADWDTNNDITALPCATAEVVKLRIGDMLLLDQDEVVIVSAISVAGQTIDLYARGHGSTTAAVLDHATAHTCYIIGNAQIENGDPITSDYTTPTAAFNYTQIFEDVAEVTGTVRRSKAVQGDYHDYTVIKKIKESLKSLNYCMLEGIKGLDATNKIGTMGGVREYNATTSNVGGALTLAKLYTAVEAHVAAGLFPSAIHGSANSASAIEQLFVGNVRYKNSDRNANMSVAVISMLGFEVELHMDLHVRSGEAIIVDYNRVGYGPLEGGENENGEFAAYPIWNKRNGKQIATQILGEYTMRCSSGGTTKAYGIT